MRLLKPKAILIQKATNTCFNTISHAFSLAVRLQNFKYKPALLPIHSTLIKRNSGNRQ